MSLRKFILVPLLLLLPMTLWAANNEEEPFIEGINYERIVPAQPAGSADKVEVSELFWYGCPHCYHFEPKVKAWLADNKPDYVVFKRVPAIFSNPRWELHARAFYTAKVLGVLDTMHPVLFDTIHKEGNPLDSKQALEKVFVQHGVSKKDFEDAFDSFDVQTQVNRSRDLSKRYGITGVPTMVVNGKYRVDGPLAGSYDNLIKIVNFLAEKEHQAAQKKSAAKN